jgi:hypothetical protein
MPRHSKNCPDTTTAPGTTSKVSNKTSKVSSRHGQKRKSDALANDAGDAVGPEPASDDKQTSPPAKRGKVSPKSQKQATSRPVSRPKGKGSRAKTTVTATETRSEVGDEDDIAVGNRPNVANDYIGPDSNSGTPRRPAKKAKSQGLRRTGTHPQLWIGDISIDSTDLETLVEFKTDGSAIVVARSDDNLPSGGEDIGKDVTPRQRDFRANEMPESDDGPAGDSEPWATPAALKKGHSFRRAFESDTNADGSSGSESEHSEGQDAGRAKRQPASKTVKVRQIKNHLLTPPLIGCP